MFSYDDIDCSECAVRWSCSLETDGPKFVPCDKHLKNVEYAGVAQAAEQLPRKQQVASSSDAASPSFEQISRCCK